MPKEILDITKDFVHDPAKICVKEEHTTLEGIRQYYVAIPEEKFKFDVLSDIYKNLEIQQAVVFCNSRKTVEYLANEMKKHDFTVYSIHEEMKWDERSETLKGFRTGSFRLLIATDMIVWTHDLQRVSLVINYELPNSKKLYLRRVGRSGRFGPKGTAINFVTPKDANFLKEIQEYYHTEIQVLPQDLSQI